MLGRGVRLNVIIHLFWKMLCKNVVIIIVFQVSAYFFVLQIVHVQLQNATRSIVMNLQQGNVLMLFLVITMFKFQNE